MKVYSNIAPAQKPIEATVYVATKLEEIPAQVRSYAQKFFDKKKNIVLSFPTEEKPFILALLIENVDNESKRLEQARCLGNEILFGLKREDYAVVQLSFLSERAENIALIEGMLLGDYQFTKYKSQKEEEKSQEITVFTTLSEEKIRELVQLTDAVAIARNLVNEPPCALSTSEFSNEITSLGKRLGFQVDVLQKKEIETLKMGGLLAVNAGSDIPPTFNILTWKPQNAKNKKPFVFVGKGVVYDTGGYNVKPGSYMDTMKSDMAGGAAVVGLLCAIAQNNLPIYVVGLIPVTDNRINSRAFVSDDVLTMMNGTTVEIKNTDAEGRLILADALTYAQRYEPELVIDLATLTGAAARITGHYGNAFMGNATTEMKQCLKNSGETVFERLIELPFWEEFTEDLKSPIADLKNLGNPEGGASSAGKFLEHFTNYPWLHIDIAGTAFLNAPYRYFKAGATGVGVRLLYDFLKKQSCNN